MVPTSGIIDNGAIRVVDRAKCIQSAGSAEKADHGPSFLHRASGFVLWRSANTRSSDPFGVAAALAYCAKRGALEAVVAHSPHRD